MVIGLESWTCSDEGLSSSTPVDIASPKEHMEKGLKKELWTAGFNCRWRKMRDGSMRQRWMETCGL